MLLGEWQSEQPGLDPRIVEFVRIRLVAVAPRHIVGRCVPVHQLADIGAQQLLLFAKAEIHRLPRRETCAIPAAQRSRS